MTKSRNRQKRKEREESSSEDFSEEHELQPILRKKRKRERKEEASFSTGISSDQTEFLGKQKLVPKITPKKRNIFEIAGSSSDSEKSAGKGSKRHRAIGEEEQKESSAASDAPGSNTLNEQKQQDVDFSTKKIRTRGKKTTQLVTPPSQYSTRSNTTTLMKQAQIQISTKEDYSNDEQDSEESDYSSNDHTSTSHPLADSEYKDMGRSDDDASPRRRIDVNKSHETQSATTTIEITTGDEVETTSATGEQSLSSNNDASLHSATNTLSTAVGSHLSTEMVSPSDDKDTFVLNDERVQRNDTDPTSQQLRHPKIVILLAMLWKVGVLGFSGAALGIASFMVYPASVDIPLNLKQVRESEGVKEMRQPEKKLELLPKMELNVSEERRVKKNKKEMKSFSNDHMSSKNQLIHDSFTTDKTGKNEESEGRKSKSITIDTSLKVSSFSPRGMMYHYLLAKNKTLMEHFHYTEKRMPISSEPSNGERSKDSEVESTKPKVLSKLKEGATNAIQHKLLANKKSEKQKVTNGSSAKKRNFISIRNLLTKTSPEPKPSPQDYMKNFWKSSKRLFDRAVMKKSSKTIGLEEKEEKLVGRKMPLQSSLKQFQAVLQSQRRPIRVVFRSLKSLPSILSRNPIAETLANASPIVIPIGIGLQYVNLFLTLGKLSAWLHQKRKNRLDSIETHKGKSDDNQSII